MLRRIGRGTNFKKKFRVRKRKSYGNIKGKGKKGGHYQALLRNLDLNVPAGGAMIHQALFVAVRKRRVMVLEQHRFQQVYAPEVDDEVDILEIDPLARGEVLSGKSQREKGNGGRGEEYCLTHVGRCSGR